MRLWSGRGGTLTTVDGTTDARDAACRLGDWATPGSDRLIEPKWNGSEEVFIPEDEGVLFVFVVAWDLFGVAAGVLAEVVDGAETDWGAGIGCESESSWVNSLLRKATNSGAEIVSFCPWDFDDTTCSKILSKARFAP